MALSLRSDVESIDPSQVPFWVSGVTIDQYFQVATVSVLVYDILITMDKEVKYFWLKETPRNVVNIVYFANRYIGLLGAVVFLFWNLFSADLRLCNFAEWTQNVTSWTTVILIDYILMIRVLALYSQDKTLSICLKTLLALEAAFKIGLIIYLTASEDVVVISLAKGVTVCGTNNLPHWRWGLVDWIIPMAYGVILMVLALYKAAEYWTMSAGFKGFALVKVLVQDQVIYFLLAVACSIFEILELKLEVSSLFLSGVLNALGSPSFLCVLGSRMLINLKEAGEQGLNEGTNYRMTSRSVSEMEFA